MIRQKKIACVIPARLAASRFPEKLLSSINGIPLLKLVYDAALQVSLFDHVIFAIDAKKMADHLRAINAPFVMTSPHHQSGTDRIAEVVSHGTITADIWVNWQGDEPFITEAAITDLLQSCNDGSDLWTLAKKITDPSEITNSGFAKVIFNHEGRALWFSRSPLPYIRDPLTNKTQHLFYKHVGLYAYTTKSLENIAKMPPCLPEKAEKLEQLRFLYYGLRVGVHVTIHETVGIDIPSDIKRAEEFLLQRSQRL